MTKDEDTTPSTGPDQEAKEKFREALDRKRERNAPQAQGVRNTGAVHGPETAGQTKRMFRRKSGG